MTPSSHHEPPNTNPLQVKGKPSNSNPMRACDTCRIRKVKCTFPLVSPSGESSTSTQTCILCKKHGFRCTFDRKVKANGRKSNKDIANKQDVKIRAILPVPRLGQDKSQSRTLGGSVDHEKGEDQVILETDHLDLHNEGVSPRPRPSLSNESPVINPLDQIVPRDLLLSSIKIFFEHLYCLTPLVHRPSFIADIESRRETRGDEEWISLILMLVAATLVQAPWAFPTLQRKEIYLLARNCYRRAKVWLVGDFNEISVDRCVTLYLACIVTAHLEENGMAEMFRGALWGFIFKLRMHEESSYEGLNSIESELRRRVYWLAFGLDKARCAIHADMVHITGEHCADVQLPKSLDDEYITKTGYLIPPVDQTPILLGFCYVSRIFEILGQVLDLRRIDRRRNPTGIHLQMRLNEVNGLLEICETILDDCPVELRLAGSEQVLATSSQTYSGSNESSFLVQQANIYMAQQMTRHLILEYRAQLRALQRHQQLQDLGQVGMPIADMHLQSGLSDEEKECVSRDVLNVLEAIPMRALAVNTTGVVNKVRFVAVSLLDGLSDTPTATGGVNEEMASRSQYHRDYLWKFLTTLGEIEAMSSLKDQE